MPKIHLLSEEVINKIAAGEVIERPASVVKELLENSLDAGATSIIIDIKDYGKERIKVTDNGEGMDEADARQAMLRHATSKIRESSDLFAISTLGFRGEALSSIAAVSEFCLTTKRKEMATAIQLTVAAGKIMTAKSMAAEPGTSIEVNNLFFNTPARKKFLKTDAVELRHIVDTVTQYALINWQVSFKLFHNSQLLLHSPTAGDFLSNIVSIYGVELTKALLPVRDSTEAIRIEGYIAKPSYARNDKNLQSIFVNNRWVRNEDITKAVYDAYHSLLFVHKHPIFVLSLQLDPHSIDVNVHPSKQEIKFEQREQVYAAVVRAVRETLQQKNLIPDAILHSKQLNLSHTISSGQKYEFDISSQGTLQVHEAEQQWLEEPVKEKIHEEITRNEEIPNKLPPLKLLGQIHKTFFVAETIGGFCMIDQHAAHERVVYEQFMAQYVQKKVQVQTLLQGEIMECNPGQKILLQEYQPVLQNFGFSYEHFGDNSFLLKTIPSIFNRLQSKDLLYELLQLVEEKRNKISEIKEIIITRMACRAAVMAGDSLSNSQMENILKELGQTELPWTCPHGRPTVIKTSVDELERKFKRK